MSPALSNGSKLKIRIKIIPDLGPVDVFEFDSYEKAINTLLERERVAGLRDSSDILVEPVIHSPVIDKAPKGIISKLTNLWQKN